MSTKNIQAAGFGKKAYAQPEMKVFEVKPAGIICQSGTSATSTQNEEYEVVSTETTNKWFN